MNLLLRLFLLLTIGTSTLVAQSTEGQWDTYIAKYENGFPGSTTVRMDLIKKAPISQLPFVLVTGLVYGTSRADGFPENETFEVLHKVGDQLEALIAKETESILVGSFMHKGERLEYFYIQDQDAIKEKIEKFYAKNYPNHKFYLNIKEDRNWQYYREFLYPNEDILNYMADEKVIMNLEKAGDNLSKPRRVDHWLYFSSEQEMNRCKEELKNLDFSVEYAGETSGNSLGFQLHIWRVDKVDISSIFPLTSELRKIAEKHKGEYDGWETSVEKE